MVHSTFDNANSVDSKSSDDDIGLDETQPSGHAHQKIQRFYLRFGANALLLAAHLAPIEILTPKLIAFIRVNFLAAPQNHDASLDANVLFSELSEPIGDGYYQLARDVRWHLMKALTQWQRDKFGLTARSRVAEVSHLVRQFLANRNLHQLGHDDVDFFRRNGWSAQAHDDPELTATQFASHISRSASEIGKENVDTTHWLAFTRLRPLISLPLSGFIELFDSSRLVEALLTDKYETAQHYAELLPTAAVLQGDVTLPSAQTLLSRYRQAHELPYIDQAELALINTSDETNSDATESSEGIGSTSPPSESAGAFENAQSSIERTSGEQSPQLNAIDRNHDHYSELEIHWFTAVEQGDLATLEQLSQQHRYLINLADRQGQTALHHAAILANEPLLDLLVQYDATIIDATDHNNRTPLMLAASFGHLSIGKKLFYSQSTKSGIEAKQCVDNEGRNFFLIAVANGHLLFVKWLLENDFNPNELSVKGESATTVAVISSRLAMVELLFEYGADIAFKRATNGNSLLQLAAIGGNPDILSHLIDWGIDPNHKNSYNQTALMYAAFYGQLAAVYFLVDHGASIWHSAADGYSALSAAIQGGHLTVVKALIDMYPSFDQLITDQLKYEWNIITTSALRGLNEILAYLATKGAPVSTIRSRGWNLLHLACQGLSEECSREHSNFSSSVKILLNHSFDVNELNPYGEAPLHIAARNNQVDILPDLLRAPNIELNLKSKQNLTPFLAAITATSISVVEALGKEPDIDFEAGDGDGNQALWLAVATHHVDTVRAVLDIPKVNRNHLANEKMGSPLWYAAQSNDDDIFSLLCQDRYVDLRSQDANGYTILHQLAADGKIELLEILPRQKVDINCVNRDRETPLILALKNNHYSFAHQLLVSGSYPIKYPATADISPIAALITSKVEMDVEEKWRLLELLLSMGASLDEVYPKNRSLMHLAVGSGNPNNVEFLIQHGVSVSDRDTMGATPLHHINQIKTESSDSIQRMIDALLKAGAEIDAVDENGLTALHYSCRSPNLLVANYLIKRGGDPALNTNYGWNCLHLASFANALEIASLCLKQRPDLKDSTTLDSSYTPLQLCAEYGSLEVCELLLKHDVDVNFHKGDQLPAIFLAAINGFDNIVSLLEKSGADTINSHNDVSITLDKTRLWRQDLQKNIVQSSGSNKNYDPWKNQIKASPEKENSSIEDRAVQITKSAKTGTPVHILATKLLRDAATFFNSLGNQNEDLRAQMEENHQVFMQLGDALEADPQGRINDKPTCELVGKVLEDAAKFFITLANQNEPIREQMLENANIYQQIAELVRKNPLDLL